MKFMKLGSKPHSFHTDDNDIRYVAVDLATDIIVHVGDVKFYLHKVRLKLVSVWLPTLIVCHDKNTWPLLSNQLELHQDLEETFLRIISTLPMSDSGTLLHRCLSFATRNVGEWPHLVSAFNTYFRLSMRPPPSLGDEVTL